MQFSKEIKHTCTQCLHRRLSQESAINREGCMTNRVRKKKSEGRGEMNGTTSRRGIRNEKLSAKEKEGSNVTMLSDRHVYVWAIGCEWPDNRSVCKCLSIMYRTIAVSWVREHGNQRLFRCNGWSERGLRNIDERGLAPPYLTRVCKV